MKHHLAKLTHNKAAKCKQAVSTIISTIILTSVLLIILLIASFVATNVLILQMNSTEFELAKTNMLLLDDTVQDTALRPGSGGYVQFNERTGGIGVTSQSEDVSISMQIGAEPILPIYDLGQLILYDLVYSAGSLTSAAAINLRPQDTSGTPVDLGTAVDTSKPIGYVRVVLDNGPKIKLDYDRMRITQVGLIDGSTNLIEITFLKLQKNPDPNQWGGSGTVNLKVENVKTETKIQNIPTGTQPVKIYIDFGTQSTPYVCAVPDGATSFTTTVILITEITIQVSKT